MPSEVSMGIILNTIIEARRPLTTRQISKITGLSWPTTKKNLLKLFDRGYIEQGALKNRIYWRLRRNELPE